MGKICNFRNVHNDDNSHTMFEDLNERKFLLNFFDFLSHEMGESFNKFSFYIFSTHDTNAVPASINGPNDPSLSILFYISEETGYVPLNLRPFYKAIFKSYLPYEPGENIHSFTLGHVNDVVFTNDFLPKIIDRDINLFFSGNFQRNRFDLYRQFNVLRVIPLSVGIALIRGPFRNLILKIIGHDFSSRYKNSLIIFTNGFMKGMSASEYKRNLLRSKIILSPKGFASTETFRLLEGLNAGCAVITERLPDLEIYRDIPAIQVDSWETGLTAVNNLLSDSDLLETIQMKSLKWWMDNCSYSSVARRVAKKICDLS